MILRGETTFYEYPHGKMRVVETLHTVCEARIVESPLVPDNEIWVDDCAGNRIKIKIKNFAIPESPDAGGRSE